MDAGATEVVSPVPPVSPWGQLRMPVEPVSLAEIMSEELAKDLQQREEDKLAQELDCDKIDVPAELLPISPDCDSDLMIAQMLQMQFDRELKKKEDKVNGASKVSISYSNYRVNPDSLLYDSDSDMEEVDDSKRNWDSFEKSEKEFPAIPKCGYTKQGETVVTKHDITMVARRNACRVMSFPPEFHTGDAGGFDMQLSNKVYNSLKLYSNTDQSRRHRVFDKTEQATAVLSLDPRTRLLLYRLVNQEVLDSINGVLSTGKEAVVVHADGGFSKEVAIPKECAVKIFKTTLNDFKTRDKYFTDKFSKQNPRKIIHLWAEKEMSNLKRLQRAGILSPDVVTLKKHVLVMSFIGADQKPAPKLKDASLSKHDAVQAYKQVYEAMKKMYTKAHLVHADLSEYNILWHEKKCWFIDVSQSVEPTHRNAEEFLLRDCNNISNFFSKLGVPDVKSATEMFTEITSRECDAIGQGGEFEKNKDFLAYNAPEKEDSFDQSWEQSMQDRVPKRKMHPHKKIAGESHRSRKHSEGDKKSNKAV